MKNGTHKGKIRAVAMLLAAFIFVLAMGSVLAHEDDGYSHDASIGYTNKDWITKLPDEMLLSQMSIPGTHDTMSFQTIGWCSFVEASVLTQSMDLTTQLNSGIRLLDIRARHIDESFAIHHDECYLGMNFDDVLGDVITFLTNNKNEFVLMKIKHEHTDANVTRSFEETLQAYVDAYSEYFWTTTDPEANPTVEELRGKIVLTNYAPGLDSDLDISQECDDPPFNGTCWQFDTNWDLYPKWENVKAQLEAADSGDLNRNYKNALNGAGGSFPYFVASGHLGPDTDAKRLATGDTTLTAPNKWPDFPRTACVGKLCTISFEGVNILTKDYIRAGNVTQRVGWIWMDFPGSGLIDEIIQLNYAFVPLATADAGGPYVVNEGEEITFDASASSAYNDAPLKYLWDYIYSDPWVWELSYIDDAMVSYTWYDDHEGTLTVAVTDDESAGDQRIVYDSARIIVNNVAPTIESIGNDAVEIDEGDTITVSGTFSDPALGVATETFSGAARWNDGVSTEVTVGEGTFSTSRTFADDHPRTGTAFDDFTADVTIKDDDRGSDTATSPPVRVRNDAPTIESINVDIATIDEGDTVTVSGTFSDIALGVSSETFAGQATWSDGKVTAVTVDSIAGTLSTSRTFADDHPATGTPSDNFTVDIMINDDDLAGDIATSPVVTVNNLPPVTHIDSIVDETGVDVGSGVRVVLIHTQIDLAGSFTDIGIPDTHTAHIDWGDGDNSSLGATSGSIAATHVYTEPGVYTALLEVTDDDTGVGPVTASIEVVDAAGAVEELIRQLELSAGDAGLHPDAASALNETLTKLEGQNGGKAGSGALDQLAKNNLNAALVKMGQAIQSLEAAEASDTSLDLTADKSLLALAAKSAALTAIVEADAAATSSKDMAVVDDAYELIDEADELLAALNYVGAVDMYRQAAQEVTGIDGGK